MLIIYCSNCGKKIDDNLSVCPYCSNKINSNCDYSENPKNKKNKVLVSVLVTISVVFLVVAIVLGSIAIKTIHKVKYLKNYVVTMELIANSTAQAENCSDLIVLVWNNSITKTNNYSTDEFTKENGEFYSDANRALAKLFSDKEFKIKLDSLKSEILVNAKLIDKLKDYPSSYENEFEKINELSNLFVEYVDLIMSPSGDFASYRKNIDTVNLNIVHKYNEIVVDFNKGYNKFNNEVYGLINEKNGFYNDSKYYDDYDYFDNYDNFDFDEFDDYDDYKDYFNDFD